MRWLDISLIKAHCRIESNCEDTLLELYGNSAEETVLNYTSRTEAELKAMGTDGKVPFAIVEASLMLVDHSYQHRSPVSPINLSSVPYTFDVKVKPYMKLTEDRD